MTAQTLALRRLPEPPFRAFPKEILEDLTTRWGRYMVCAILCQNQRPRACVISDRGGTRWVLWALSKLTCVKGVIAHSSHAAGNAGRCPAVAGPISPPSRKYGLEIWPALWRRYGGAMAGAKIFHKNKWVVCGRKIVTLQRLAAARAAVN